MSAAMVLFQMKSAFDLSVRAQSVFPGIAS